MRARVKSEAILATRPSLPVRYGVAVVSVALVLLLKLLLDPLIEEQSPFLLLAAAVMIGAWFGGLGPGLLATALGSLAADYFFLPPAGSFTGLGLHALPLLLFAVQGLVISLLTEALHAARQRAEASTREARDHEEGLRRSEERFRLLVEGVKDYAIFMLYPDGRVASWNEGAQRTMGYGAGEVIGKHFSLFFAPEDVRRGRPERELRVASEEGRFEEESWRVRKDGSRFWADVVVTAVQDETGDPRGFAKVVRDVTERKEAEEALRRSLDALVALFEAGQVLGSSLEREEIGSKLVGIARRISNLDAAVIDLLDGSGRLSEWSCAGAEEVLAAVREEPGIRSAVREVFETGRLRSLELAQPSVMESARHLKGLLVPLRVRNRVIGVLEGYGSEEALAEKEAGDTLASLANQAASTLENARLYEELAERERRLENLVERLVAAQEEERRRVAYEVHDGLTQLAVAAHQRLEIFEEDYALPSQGRQELQEAIDLVRRTVAEARRVIADLRPTTLDDFGLAAAIRMQVEDLREQGYRVDYEEALGDESFPVALETTLFRIAQEALNNARKHAGTERVRVVLARRDGRVRLEIRDWGRGFEPAEVEQNVGGPGERVGLSSMRERVALLGGEFEIRSEPGAGTSVVAEVPLPPTMEEGGDGGE
jgi:PAS domain S-box-containing protein